MFQKVFQSNQKLRVRIDAKSNSGNRQKCRCKPCGKHFSTNLRFENMHAAPETITAAMNLYFGTVQNCGSRADQFRRHRQMAPCEQIIWQFRHFRARLCCLHANLCLPVAATCMIIGFLCMRVMTGSRHGTKEPFNGISHDLREIKHHHSEQQNMSIEPPSIVMVASVCPLDATSVPLTYMRGST